MLTLVREVIDDPHLAWPAHGDRDRLGPDLDRADRREALAVDAENLEPVVGRVQREQQPPSLESASGRTCSVSNSVYGLALCGTFPAWRRR